MFSFLRSISLFLSGARRDALSGEYLPVTIAGESDESPAEDVFAQWDGPLERIPETRAEIYETFGNPGAEKVDKAWERRNMFVAKDLPVIYRKYVHKKAEPYLREFLRRCVIAGVDDEIRKLGCWSFRHQRHDPSRPLSDHAWGIAIDINPRDNRAVRFPKRNPPKAWSPEWVEIWPDSVSETLVRIAKAVGFEWGGDWKGLCDPMHFSLRRRP